MKEWSLKFTCRTPEETIRWLLLANRRSINVLEFSVILVGLSISCSRLYMLVRLRSFHLRAREASFFVAKMFTLKSPSSITSASNEIEDNAVSSSSVSDSNN